MSVDGSSDAPPPVEAGGQAPEGSGGESAATGAAPPIVGPARIPQGRVGEDRTFLVRSPSELDDVSSLATDLARLGQLFPIDVRLQPPDRFQILTGFRRVAALRFLQRDKVLARLHTDLSDQDAQLLALASAIHGAPVEAGALLALRERLEAAGTLSPVARDMLDKALETESSLGPEETEEEVDADELSRDVTVRLGVINQELSVLADVFGQLELENRQALLEQLRFSAQLVEWLEHQE